VYSLGPLFTKNELKQILVLRPATWWAFLL
jgi:hypothetical protein